MNSILGFSIPTMPNYNASNITIFFNQAVSSERTP